MDERYLDYMTETWNDGYFDFCDLHGLDSLDDASLDLYRDHLNS